MIYDLVVAGGGAAGFYCALHVAERVPEAKILIVEKSPRLLAKVAISGGGRCNVTHSCFEAGKLARHYPRGGKFLKEIFKIYGAADVVNWFASKGVKLKTEDDGRMFPVTDDSNTIIECFMREAAEKKIRLTVGNGVRKIIPGDASIDAALIDGSVVTSKNFMVAVGGIPSRSGYAWLEELGITIVSPVPSLFTFNDPSRTLADLMGISVSNAHVRIAGSSFSSQGPLLITHWGLSGPAVIRLSAWAAEYLHGVGYRFTVLVNWCGGTGEDDARKILLEAKASRGRQRVAANPLFALPLRLWARLCGISEIPEEKIWAEVPQRNLNKLMEALIRFPLPISGKTTFKEEFVTCGGVDLAEIDRGTMECRKIPGLYFAGEVLNIDGETGGFNFQAAWSTAYVAARAIANRLSP